MRLHGVWWPITMLKNGRVDKLTSTARNTKTARQRNSNEALCGNVLTLSSAWPHRVIRSNRDRRGWWRAQHGQCTNCRIALMTIYVHLYRCERWTCLLAFATNRSICLRMRSLLIGLYFNVKTRCAHSMYNWHLSSKWSCARSHFFFTSHSAAIDGIAAVRVLNFQWNTLSIAISGHTPHVRHTLIIYSSSSSDNFNWFFFWTRPFGISVCIVC